LRIEDEIKQTEFTDEFMKAVLNIFVTADRLSSATNAALRPFGVSKEQFNVLRILRGQHPTPSSVGSISDRMISKSSNATRLVEKLRQKAYVERNLCPTNRRQVDILITEKGLSALSEMDLVVRSSSNDMRTLTKAESRQLNRLLDKMRE
jgi:DNA-binding MarR family transcriptional regulator